MRITARKDKDQSFNHKSRNIIAGSRKELEE